MSIQEKIINKSPSLVPVRKKQQIPFSNKDSDVGFSVVSFKIKSKEHLHRIIEWVGLEGDLEDHLLPTPSSTRTEILLKSLLITTQIDDKIILK